MCKRIYMDQLMRRKSEPEMRTFSWKLESLTRPDFQRVCWNSILPSTWCTSMYFHCKLRYMHSLYVFSILQQSVCSLNMFSIVYSIFRILYSGLRNSANTSNLTILWCRLMITDRSVCNLWLQSRILSSPNTAAGNRQIQMQINGDITIASAW